MRINENMSLILYTYSLKKYNNGDKSGKFVCGLPPQISITFPNHPQPIPLPSNNMALFCDNLTYKS